MGADGSLTQTAPRLDTGGTRPETVVTWRPDDGGGDPADVDGDGTVGFADLLAVLAAWGTADPAADVDGNGTVEFADLLLVLAGWDG